MGEVTHKLVGNHAQEVAGVMYAVGETMALDKAQQNDPLVKDMIENGVLMVLKNEKGGEK